MQITLSKIIWGIRALGYKLFVFRSFGVPSYMGSPCFVLGGRNIDIGSRVRIFPGLRMEAYSAEGICLCDNVYLGQNVHITADGSKLYIGEGTAILNNVCITNIDHEYEQFGKPVLEQGRILRRTQIGKNCFIGHNAVIQAGVELGNNCVVGAGTVVKRGLYCDGSVIVGVPGKIVKQYNQLTKSWDMVKVNN